LKSNKIATWLAFSCPHFPIEDRDGIAWLLRRVRTMKPQHVVCLGDMFDADCLSAFASAKKGDLAEEYAAVDGFCEKLMDAAPKASFTWMMGNHEERMFRPEFQMLAGVLDYRRQIKSARRWRHVFYGFGPQYTHQIGQVTFYHGATVGRNSVKSEAITLGVPYGLCVSGHTHRPHPVHRISTGVTPLPYWHVNAGTFIKPKPEYMRTKNDSLWGEGCVVGEAITGRRFFGRQNWKAELVLHKMHWEGAEFAP